MAVVKWRGEGGWGMGGGRRCGLAAVAGEGGWRGRDQGVGMSVLAGGRSRRVGAGGQVGWAQARVPRWATTGRRHGARPRRSGVVGPWDLLLEAMGVAANGAVGWPGGVVRAGTMCAVRPVRAMRAGAAGARVCVVDDRRLRAIIQ